MKKLFMLFGLLAMVGGLFVACSDQQDLTSPEEAAFGKGKPTECVLDPEVVTLAIAIREDIGTLFNGKKKVKAATEIFNNIERKVCKSLYADATNTAYDFYVMTYRQLPHKLTGDETDAAALVSKIFEFASNSTAPVIPPEAMEPTGGVGIVQPGAKDTIWTNNDEAAFIADPLSFPGTEPVVVVMQRLADPTGAGFPIPGYQAYPEAYDFSATVQLDPNGPGAEFWMCVPDDVPVPFANLVIGHATGGGNSELLTPALYETELGDVLDCSNAAYVAVAGALAGTPGWLLLAGTILEPVVSRVLDVQPLNAMYFAGKGLGGRGTSFSDFAPVDGSSGDPREIVFTSYRDGYAEIYGMDADGSSPINLTNSPTLDAGAAWSPTGDRIAFQSRREAGTGDVWLMEANGANPINLTADADSFQLHPTWSPDGTRIAFMNRTPFDRIYVMDSDGTNRAHLAGIAGSDAAFPAWSPDGTRIAFSSTRDGDPEIYVMDADGTNQQRLTNNSASDLSPKWAPDGSKIAWITLRDGNSEVYVMDPNGDNKVNLTDNAASDRMGTWSPDGIFIVFDSNRTGDSEIYVMGFDGSNPTQITDSPGEDNSPAWRPVPAGPQ